MPLLPSFCPHLYPAPHLHASSSSPSSLTTPPNQVQGFALSSEPRHRQRQNVASSIESRADRRADRAISSRQRRAARGRQRPDTSGATGRASAQCFSSTTGPDTTRPPKGLIVVFFPSYFPCPSCRPRSGKTWPSLSSSSSPPPPLLPSPSSPSPPYAAIRSLLTNLAHTQPLPLQPYTAVAAVTRASLVARCRG